MDVSGRWIVGHADYALIDRGSRIVPCDVLWFWNRFRPTVLYRLRHRTSGAGGVACSCFFVA